MIFSFDRVPHNILIYKLKCLCIDGNLLDAIKDLLTGRTLRVSVEGKLSSIKDVCLVFHKGQFWDHCCLLFLSMTYQTM